MAKIKFGALMVDARGKAGGTVFSKNRSGSYLKNKVTPTNPQSSKQTNVRAQLASLAQRWRALSQDQRNSFISVAPNFPLKNVYGDTYYLAGNMLYNQLNMNLKKVNVAEITEGPNPVGTDEVLIQESSSASTASILVELSNTLSLNQSAVIRATPLMSAGILNFKTKLRDVTLATSVSPQSIDIIAPYTAMFGTPITGSRIGLSVQVVNELTGEAGTPSFYSVLVQ